MNLIIFNNDFAFIFPSVKLCYTWLIVWAIEWLSQWKSQLLWEWVSDWVSDYVNEWGTGRNAEVFDLLEWACLS